MSPKGDSYKGDTCLRNASPIGAGGIGSGDTYLRNTSPKWAGGIGSGDVWLSVTSPGFEDVPGGTYLRYMSPNPSPAGQTPVGSGAYGAAGYFFV